MKRISCAYREVAIERGTMLTSASRPRPCGIKKANVAPCRLVTAAAALAAQRLCRARERPAQKKVSKQVVCFCRRNQEIQLLPQRPSLSKNDRSESINCTISKLQLLSRPHTTANLAPCRPTGSDWARRRSVALFSIPAPQNEPKLHPKRRCAAVGVQNVAASYGIRTHDLSLFRQGQECL